MIWEYTDDTTGGTSTAKEEAPKEAAAKKGQVCSLPPRYTADFPLVLVVVFVHQSVSLSSLSSLPFGLHCFGVYEQGLSSVSQANPATYCVAQGGLESLVVFQPQPLRVLGLWT